MSLLELPEDIIRLLFNEIIKNNIIIENNIIDDNSIDAMMNVYFTCKSLHNSCDRILTFDDFGLSHLDMSKNPSQFKRIHAVYLRTIKCRIYSISALIIYEHKIMDYKEHASLVLRYTNYINNILIYLSKITNNIAYLDHIDKVLVLKIYFINEGITVELEKQHSLAVCEHKKNNNINLIKFIDLYYFIGEVSVLMIQSFDRKYRISTHDNMIGFKYASKKKLYKFLQDRVCLPFRLKW